MQERVSMQPYAVRNGLFLGVISSIYAIGLYITDFFLNPSFQWVNWPISLALTIFFIVQTFNGFKKENEGYMSLGEGFKGAFLTTFVSSLISTTVTYVYMAIVDPSVLTRSLDMQREAMLQNPDINEEQVEQVMAMAEKFTTPEITAVIGLVIAVFVGAVISLIMALISKKEHETY